MNRSSLKESPDVCEPPANSSRLLMLRTIAALSVKEGSGPLSREVRRAAGEECLATLTPRAGFRCTILMFPGWVRLRTHSLSQRL
jgi:hypothetical protein